MTDRLIPTIHPHVPSTSRRVLYERIACLLALYVAAGFWIAVWWLVWRHEHP